MQDLMPQVGPLIPALRRYARALLHDRAAADDLVQDCLERVVGHWHQRRPDGAVRAWVFAILHNLAMNRLQQSRRRGLHLALEDADEAAVVSPPAQEHALRHGELLRALATLPEEQRSVLLLVSVEDFSYAETARALAIPLGTVMSRLARARDKLQRAMDAETPGVAPRPALRRIK
ncbi:MAG TPA: sigma-70 family RNA polymerase sigma factor [Stellaceae bacterium]|jgi:RNA polymerase sigma-70 factor (ECF subfamily)|nr:sigma-70 family RNA polymerase sigma factor [Stellaceae bacterium]